MYNVWLKNQDAKNFLFSENLGPLTENLGKATTTAGGTDDWITIFY